MKDIEVKLCNFKNKLKNQKFILYGGGNAGYLFIKYFCKENNLKPYLVLDRKFSSEGRFLGFPALNPLKYKPNEEEKKKSIVVIAVNKEKLKKDIRNFLNFLNLKKIVEIPEEIWEYLIWKDALHKQRVIFETNGSNNIRRFCNNLQFSNTCIIHVGMHKTGSTSIQLTLNNYEDDRFYYAKLSPDGCHNLPVCILYKKNLQKHPYFKGVSVEELKGNQEKFREMLIKNILARGEKNLIISAEHVLLLNYKELKHFKNFLDYYFKKVLIYSYVREPFGYLSSIFQQNLKYFNVKINQLTKWYPNYKKTFQKFFKVFGEENVILKKFDPARFPDGCVVKDFCQTLGIAIERRKIIRANASLPKEAVNLIYILRKYFSKINFFPWQIEYFLNDFLLENILKDIPLHKFKISKELIKPIVEKHKDDIKWMEEKLGEPLINPEDLEKPEPDYVIKNEEDLLSIPEELFERLRDYTNYKPSEKKPISEQVAEMLLTLLAENFPDIKAQVK